MRSVSNITLTIANGQTTSDQASTHLPARALGQAVEVIVFAPAALTGTVTVEVAPTDASAAGGFRQLSVAGADVTVAAGDATLIPTGGFRDLRLVSSGAEGADRTFTVAVIVEI